MPVNSRHPEYSKNLRRWRICRAVCEGEDAVKEVGAFQSWDSQITRGASPTVVQVGFDGGSQPSAGGVSWDILPPLSGHTTYGEYFNYVTNAHFFPAASRAREGLVGLLVKDPAVVTYPAAMESFVTDVTSSGSPQDVNEFAGRIIFEVMTSGRCGILTDYSPRPVSETGALKPPPKKREAEIRGIKPRWRLYNTEQIINWRMDRVRGRETLGLLVLEEDAVAAPAPDAEDQYAWIEVTQWRVLDRQVPPPELASKLPREAEYGDGKACRVRFATLDEKGHEVYSAPIWPMVNGELSEEIPFDFVGARNCGPTPDKPPLYDVVTVNVGHYRNSAALEHGLYFCANPMAYVFGYDPEEEEPSEGEVQQAGITRAVPGQARKLRWTWGSSQILVLKNAQAQAGVISASASDMSALSERILVKRDELTTLVGRILAAEKMAAEAAATEQIRRQGEQGVLSSLAGNVSDTLTRCLTRARDLMAAEGEVKVVIPTKFWDPGLTVADAVALADLWLKYGVLAKSDVRAQLRAAGRLDRTDKEVDAELALDPIPAAPAGLVPAGGIPVTDPAAPPVKQPPPPA